MRKRTKKPQLALELVDALADLIASRVATKMVEAQKPPTRPEMVPIWLAGPKPPKGSRRPRETASPGGSKENAEALAERALRGAGMVRMGDPGYRELLDKHLVSERARQAEIAERAQLRKVARLVEKLVAEAAVPRDIRAGAPSSTRS